MKKAKSPTKPKYRIGQFPHIRSHVITSSLVPRPSPAHAQRNTQKNSKLREGLVRNIT